MKIELIEYQNQELLWYYKVTKDGESVIFHHSEAGLKDATALFESIKNGEKPHYKVLKTYTDGE